MIANRPPAPTSQTPPPRRRPNQVILSGPLDQVDRLTRELQQQPGHRTRELTQYPSARGPVRAVLIHFKPPDDDDCDRSALLNRRILDLARKLRLTEIRTEPNCTTGSPFAWEGDPFAWEGDPFAWEGDPFAWEGDPYAKVPGGPGFKPKQVVPVGSNPADAGSLFANQDAFQRIQLTEGGKRRKSLQTRLGAGVRVGIFDTCPNQPLLAGLPGGSPAWLTPHYPPAGPLPSGEFVDHGLFVASLIHFVAPKAEIHLYQVLEGNVYGETATLVTALGEFVNAKDDGPAVINLSLGSMCGCGLQSMPAVEGLLWRAVERGMVVCAAAGNGGRPASKACAIPNAQMPAILPYVIAVAASNREEIRATYSQRGDIAAPGGETAGVPGPNGFDDMIGLGTASPTGFISMDCGTSFSTPLVAGAAALVSEELALHGAPLDSGMWHRVFQRLSLGAVLPPGEPGTLNTTGLGAGSIRLSGRGTLRDG